MQNLFSVDNNKFKIDIMRLLVLLSFAFLSGLTAFSQDSWQQKVEPQLFDRLSQQPQVDFFAVLHDQPDTRSAQNITGKRAKGAFVANELRVAAQETQKPILALLQSLNADFRSFYLINAVWVRGDYTLIEELARRPEVAQLLYDAPLQYHEPIDVQHEPDDAVQLRTPEWGLNKIGAPNVWVLLGITGEGVVVGGQDTGYEWDHPAIQSQYRGWDGSQADHNYNWHDAIHEINPNNNGSNPCGLNSPVPCDDHNHGTHTMGTMVGDDGGDNQIGVAPGAKWIGCRNMERGWGTLSTYIECFEWFLAPYPVGADPSEGDPSMAPDVINNSWSCPASEGCNSSNYALMEASVNNLVNAGVVVVVSAGNSGSNCGTVNTPAAIFENSFSIGATNSTDVIATFSSRGPVTVDGSNRLKPNVSAPGVSVRSCIRDGGYASFSGTSMAGPHVAGAVALMLSAEPALVGEVELVRTTLESTALPLTTTQNCGGIPPGEVPNNTYGHGRINVFNAVLAFTALPVEWIHFSATPTTGAVSLEWTTENEQQNSHFEVWKRTGDNQGWTLIGEVPAQQAEAGAKLEYQWLDTRPVLGYQYYRLRQVDFGGSFLWSNTDSAFFGAEEAQLELWPNPGSDRLYVKLLNAQDARWTLFSAAGQQVSVQAVNANEWSAEFDFAQLPAGVYYLQAQQAGGTYTARWVKR